MEQVPVHKDLSLAPAPLPVTLAALYVYIERRGVVSMVGLQLIAGAFLIIAGCCVIARAIGYSPEESARKRIERCEEMLSEMEDRLRRIQATAETSQEKKKVEDLEEDIEMLRQYKDLLERGS